MSRFAKTFPRSLSPPQVLLLSFSGTILVGTGLLLLPMATSSGESPRLVDALFTAASAVCVTGLIVVDTPKFWSPFGQAVILVLIQLGGLGYMTVSSFIALLLRRRVSLRERLVLQKAVGQTTMEGLGRFVKRIIIITLLVEGVAALILTMALSRLYPLQQALFLGLFHAVSAFNNAGFSLFSDSLISYATDPVINLTMTTAIILGGIGYLVIAELYESRQEKRRYLSLHTKLVLTITGGLLLFGTLSLLVVEWGNPATLQRFSIGDRILIAYFQAVTPRTAGFNTVAIGSLRDTSLFLLLILMFIGASPGGTGGGIKTTTFGSVLITLWRRLRGEREINVFGRRLSPAALNDAFVLSGLSFFFVNAMTLVLMVTEGQQYLATVFEVTSAFATVGLSTGALGLPMSLCSLFSEAGKLLITGTMLVGRVGPVTVGTALLFRGPAPSYHLLEEEIPIG